MNLVFFWILCIAALVIAYRLNQWLFNLQRKIILSAAQGGDIYEGEFKNGLLNGQGKIIYKNGTIKEGEFINGKFKG